MINVNVHPPSFGSLEEVVVVDTTDEEEDPKNDSEEEENLGLIVLRVLGILMRLTIFGIQRTLISRMIRASPRA